MDNYGGYITPEKAKAFGDVRSLKELRNRARIRGKCSVCHQFPIWRYGVSDLCFSCTTGEHDASNDFELTEE